jgi:glucosyl-dolichyl phosphate glucuronosyltransferase
VRAPCDNAARGHRAVSICCAHHNGLAMKSVVSPAVSVIICCHSTERWPDLVRSIASVQRQRRPANELILVVDHNEPLLNRARSTFDGVDVIPNAEDVGLSGARNTGVRRSNGQVLVFLDDDAEAEPDWLEVMLKAFDEPLVIGAGGFARARWRDGAPAWLPDEFLWVVGASYRGLPRERAAIRNPIGVSMAFRRQAFEIAGGFAHGIGRLGAIPLGCEETEFAIRVRQAAPESLIVYVPEARVDHHVASHRATWRYFFARCWAEGISKAIVAANVGRTDGLASERLYVTRTLPRGVLAGLRSTAHGDPSGLARSLAIVAGLAVTTAGYVRGRMGAEPNRRRNADNPLHARRADRR